LVNWDDLRIFLALARNPSLKAAARGIGIDPTTMSRRLARLAHSMNATLFEQQGGQHLLTPRGTQLLAYAERAEAAMIEAAEAGVGDETGGLIRIAAPESFGTHFLGPRLHAFQQQHPRVEIELISPSWYSDPLKREVDVAILPSQPMRGPLLTRRLADTTLHLYGSDAYFAQYGPIETLADLKAHRFVGYLRNVVPNNVTDYSDVLQPGIVTAIRTTSSAVQERMIESGAGLGLLPYFTGRANPRLLPVLMREVRIPQSFWLVVREDVRHLNRIDEFLDWLAAEVRGDPTFFQDPEPA
jgi:DNA-binding transcriptional LysR family regulator